MRTRLGHQRASACRGILLAPWPAKVASQAVAPYAVQSIVGRYQEILQ